MLIDRPFLKLPRLFCAETLAAEVRALPESAWVAHPSNYESNDAVLLVTPGSGLNHAFAGPMGPTEYLKKCPYIMEVMTELRTVWGRSRLMGLEPGSQVPNHIDVNYHWRTHIRLHIPIQTNPDVIFTCDDEAVHMAPGECWTFDSFRPHQVRNDGTEKRIHLVLDTVGSGPLWDLIDQAKADADVEPVAHGPGQGPVALAFERLNVSRIMSPWEIRCHLDYLRGLTVRHPLLDPIHQALDRFVTAWSGAWARYGDSEEGVSTYRHLIVEVQKHLQGLGGGGVVLTNGLPLYNTLTALIFRMAVAQPRQLPVK